MPTLMPSDTAAVLGANAEKCDSRSLLLDRFADPTAKEDARKQVFTRLFNKPLFTGRLKAWSGWVAGGRNGSNETIGGQSANPLYAQLQSRLMVNMAGGVMENAGLCLDRFGLPYIPGSAVKGCARRATLAALREWCETGQKPGASEADKDNVFKAACEMFASPADMLAAIARVFGWSEQDWKTREEILKGFTPRNNEDDAQFQARCQKIWAERRSDFAWACGDTLWASVREKSRELLGNASVSSTANGVHKDLSGSVSFLPAYVFKSGASGLPVVEPELGTLELDVVTCHHGDYYGDPDPAAKASDTEEPVPVVFPAVAPGHVFGFVIRTLRDCSVDLLRQARTWLATGLATFGLGAKTSAGYGWFDTSEKVQTAVLAALQRASLKPDQALWDEFQKWDDKQVRKAAAAYAFAALAPKTGRESTAEFRFTLAKFILEQRTALFLAQKNHAGSDFAKGVKRLAEEFQLPLP